MEDDDSVGDVKGMLSGAYSKQYRGLQSQRMDHLKLLEYNNKADSLARSKKLTQETNKRRRALAAKRRAEADREERRRKLILNKRREQQREATERYQRSHIPSRPSSHTGSGQTSPTGNKAIDDTLRLVRGSLSRQNSTGSMVSSTSGRSTGKDPLSRPYFNKYSNIHQPSSPADNKAYSLVKEAEKRDKLHDKSLRNLSNSRSLFEEQLDHHQQLLVQDQQKSLYEFNNAIMHEIASDRTIQGMEEEDLDMEGAGMVRSESVESMDSLENNGPQNRDRGYKYPAHHDEDQYSPDNNTPGYFEPVFDANQNYKVSPHETNTFTDHPNRNELTNAHKDAGLTDHNLNEKQTFFMDSNEKIDSFNVDHVPSPPSARPPVKPEIRPKAHVRAWATPSPVDQPRTNSASSGVSNMSTKSNPFSARNTMTSVTTTTAYGDGGTTVPHSYVQSNAWTEETDSLQQQYASNNTPATNNTADPYTYQQIMSFANSGAYTQSNPYNSPATATAEQYVTSTYQQQRVASAPVSTNSASREQLNNTVNNNLVQPHSQTPVSHESGKNLDFLETMTNGMLEVTSNVTSTTTSTQPSSRLPRPVSMVRSNMAASNTVMTPKVTQPVINSASHGVSQTPNKPPIATASTGVGFGFVHGKLSVLPDHPAVQMRHVTYQTFRAEEPPSVVGIQKKAKDDSELMKSTVQKDISDGEIVQGILKRRPASGGILKKAGSTGSMNKKFDVRDSLELARSHLQEERNAAVNQPPKKSVRFADHDLYDDEDEAEHNEDGRFLSRNPGYAQRAAMRPSSAKAVLQTTKIEPMGKPPRVASAGIQRTWIGPPKHKSTIRPQAAAHIITQNQPGVTNGVDKKVTVTNNNFMSKVPVQNGVKSQGYGPAGSEITVYNLSRLNNAVAAIKNETTVHQQQLMPVVSNLPPSQGSVGGQTYDTTPVYDENGVRIDRTPTDDEINFLWDKVRTCLNRSSTAPTNVLVESPRSVPPQEQQPVQPRQAANMSSTYIDGAALGQLYNTRVAPNYTQTHTQPYGNQASYQRKPSSANDQSPSRRYGLLQQRRQHNPNSLGKSPASAPQREFITYHGPVISNNEPQQGTASAQPPDGSESMAAFMVAEQLTQQSMSDSQINAAMEEAQRRQQTNNNARPTQKVPSALSIEEQRLLESLDRINEKLKISEFPGTLPTQATQPQNHGAPHHFTYTNGFKGSKPLMSQPRTTNLRGGSSAVLRPTNIRF